MIKECTDINCIATKLDHIHIELEHCEPEIDDIGFQLLVNGLTKQGAHDRFKITPNGDLVLSDAEFFNISIHPNYAAYIPK